MYYTCVLLSMLSFPEAQRKELRVAMAMVQVLCCFVFTGGCGLLCTFGGRLHCSWAFLGGFIDSRPPPVLK